MLGGIALLAGLGGYRVTRSAISPVVRMISDRLGASVSFQPTGLLIEVGQTVRWLNESGVHTVTAYHPDNGGRPLRIPQDASPWDSGYLVEPGEIFERFFTVPGVYDYFCAPHEAAGMVGRLVVIDPGASSGQNRAEMREEPPRSGTTPIPPAAINRLPSVDEIVRRGRVES